MPLVRSRAGPAPRRRSRRRARSNSTSRSPNRDYRKSDQLGPKRSDSHSNKSSKLLEMSMQSSSRMTSDILEPQKRLSIKDRLGPIRGPPPEDRSDSALLHKHSQGPKNKRQSNDEIYDGGFGRDHWKGNNGPNPGKTERSINTKISPNRKEKWLVENRLKFAPLVET